MRNSVVTTLVMASVLVSQLALAKPDREGRGQPPQEAIAACEGKSQGDEASFSTPHGHNVSGTCQTIQDVLVAVPEGHSEKKRDNQRN